MPSVISSKVTSKLSCWVYGAVPTPMLTTSYGPLIGK
jgi:hypothetical protein